MTTIFRREDGSRLRDARKLARGAYVLAIDPGEHGAAMTRVGSKLVFRSLDVWGKVAQLVNWNYPVVVLLEDQFAGKNIWTAKETSFTSGALAGYLFARRPPAFTLVHVAPATWQAAQRRRMGVPGSQLTRGEGIRLALKELASLAPRASAAVNVAQREGYASALGIWLWFQELVQ